MTSSARVTPLGLFATALYLLAWPAVMLFLAGNWRWREGWIFGGWFLAVCISSLAWLYRHDPALLAERYRLPPKTRVLAVSQDAVFTVNEQKDDKPVLQRHPLN